MMSNSRSQEKVAVPAGTDAHKRKAAFMRAFERARVGVAIVAAAVAFNTATVYAQDNSDAAALNKIVENNKKIVEEVKKIDEAKKKEAEAAKKEAEAAKKEAEQCKKMKEILDTSEKECSMGKCDKDDKAWLAEAWKAYVDKCSKIVVEKK